jgi:Tfp pilus assembly protein PilF
MWTMAFGRTAVLVLVMTMAAVARAHPEEPPLGAACNDAVARGVWELAIDLCSPELLPANASSAMKAQVLLGRAAAYEKTGDKGRAAADVAEASKLDPDSADVHAARARGLQAKGNHAGALKEIETAFDKTSAPSAGFHFLRAAILHDLRQDDQALPDLDRAITLDPKNAQAYAMRANIYLARRDDGHAQADIQSATSLAKNCELKPQQQTYKLTCPDPGE